MQKINLPRRRSNGQKPGCRALLEPLECRRLLSVSSPFHGTPFAANQVIEAEDFDNGGEGVAYHDTTAADLGSLGNLYRSTAVDIQAGGSNGYDVGYTAAGEWLKYTIKISQSGAYQLQASVANTSAGATFHVEFNGVNATGSMVVPNTGAWQSYKTVASQTFILNAGLQVMRVCFDHPTLAGAAGNFDWFKIVPASSGKLAWHAAAPGPIARIEAQGAVVGQKLYVMGGYYTHTPKWTACSEADAYSPATDTWQKLAPLPHPVTHAAVAAVGTDIWFAGGYTMRSDGEQIFGSTDVFKYNTLTNTWSTGPSLPAARGAAVMIAFGNQLHVMGGVDPKRGEHADHWVLDLSQPNPKWTVAAPLPGTRNHLSGGVINGKIYLAGGQIGYVDSLGNQKTLFIYDPSTNTWSRGADMPEVRSHTSFSTVVVNGKLVVIGGITANDVALANVDEYNPLTNKWTSLTPLPTRRKSPVAAYIGGRLIVTTGWDWTFEKTTFVSSLIT